MRVLRYEASIYHESTRSSSTNTYAFTQAQADEVGGVLEPDGLSIVLARRLVDKWTRRGDRGSIRYRYSLLVEDQLRALDERKSK